jgi:hypothetical protein
MQESLSRVSLSGYSKEELFGASLEENPPRMPSIFVLRSGERKRPRRAIFKAEG